MTQFLRAAHVIVTGLVQGVGFRFHASAEAQRLGLAGYVKNLPNGNVELVLEGSRQAVAAMLDWLREGPRHAEVTGVHVTESAPKPYDSFSIQH